MGLYSTAVSVPLAPETGHPVACYRGRLISRSAFIADVRRVAGALPEARHVINLCANRYRFAVGFCAALLRGQSTLLPPDRSIDTLVNLARSYPETVALADVDGLNLPLPCYLYENLHSPRKDFAGDFVVTNACAAAMVFTSGSTGRPQPHLKAWETLSEVTSRTVKRYELDAGMCYTVIATVPPQHMYGLESSIILPLQHGFVIHESQPFFPGDLAEATRASPGPFVLVTSPIHLRALLDADVELRDVALVISATAPLTAEEAALVQKRFDTRVLEVYGSTETCILATRHTAAETHWRLLEGLELRPTPAGLELDAPYLPAPWLMQDRLELSDAMHFRLLGRAADTVKVGGKRASLAGLSAGLCAIEGVRDGIFFMPEAKAGTTSRLLAFAVAPGVNSKWLRQRLRERIDPAFMPRPLLLVANLPRNACGKLTRAALNQLAVSMGVDQPRGAASSA